MIRINFFKNGFDVLGHANFDKDGKDIVCASVSGVVLGSLNWFEKSDISECNIDKLNASISLRLNNVSKDNIVALDLIKTQLSSIQENYPSYLQINLISEIID